MDVTALLSSYPDNGLAMHTGYQVYFLLYDFGS